MQKQSWFQKIVKITWNKINIEESRKNPETKKKNFIFVKTFGRDETPAVLLMKAALWLARNQQ